MYLLQKERSKKEQKEPKSEKQKESPTRRSGEAHETRGAKLNAKFGLEKAS